MNQTTHEVYDIENGLATYFIWPGDLINTHAYDHMSVFNVTEDRTMMVTQGYIYLAFNVITYTIENELLNSDMDVFADDNAFITKCNNFSYLYYKNCDYGSILEYGFREDWDKMP